MSEDAGLGAKIGAAPFVPGGGSGTFAVDAAPFVPGGAPAAAGAAAPPPPPLRSAGSSLSLSAAALSAPVFVPGGGGGSGLLKAPSVGAAPFQPAAATAAAPADAPAAAAAGEHAAQLPEGDDLLGLSEGDAAEPSLAAQAAAALRAMQVLDAVPGGGGGAGGAMPPPLAATAYAAGAAGRGGGGPGPGGGRFGAPGRGRGRGAGPGGARLPPGRAPAASLFLPEPLAAEMQRRTYLAGAAAEPGSEAAAAMGGAATLQRFHTLLPLEDLHAAAVAPPASPGLGVRCAVVKGVHAGDGRPYALRRLDGRAVVPTAALLESAEAAVARWAAAGLADHPGVAAPREAFVTDEGFDGRPALVFASDFHAGAATLAAAHLAPGAPGPPPGEDLLWSYAAQLVALLRSVHGAGLAVWPQALAPTKVLVAPPGRLRLGAAAVPEALAGAGAGGEPPPPAEAARLQRADLAAAGELLLALACAPRGARPSLGALAGLASRELARFVAGLLAAPEGAGFDGWRAAAAALADRPLDALLAAQRATDSALSELEKEAANGRVARLLLRLGFVLERPQLGGDAAWAETGDRYLLALFRDFVFHQVGPDGAPLLDWGAALEALGKADAGSPERVLLLSRDEGAMLAVSYADVRRCLAAAWAELRAAAEAGAPEGAPEGQR